MGQQRMRRVVSTMRGVTTEEVLRSLETLLASATFAGMDRQKKFLRFVVEKTLQEPPAELKEYVLALEVLDRPPSFDPRTDSIVPVAAHKLRDNLANY